MKRFFSYSFFFKGAIYLLLLNQLGTSTLPYCHWLMDTNIESVEFFDIEDSDTEEEDNKKDKEKKIRTDLFAVHLHLFLSKSKKHLTEILPLLVIHPEISTPPPECELQIS